MPANKPTQYLQWNPSQSNVTQPVDTLRARGYQTNESPTAQNFNWLLWLQDQWIQYFDQSLTSAVMTTTLDSSMRLMGGGTLSYSVASSSFTWSSPLFLSIPSIPDNDNLIAAGNVNVSAGQVLYVQANVPFTSLGDVTSGTATVQNVAYTAGIASGQAVTGAGIAANTTVLSVSGTTITLSSVATSSGQQIPLTYAGTGPLIVQAANVASLVPSANTIILGRATATALYLGINSGQIILRDNEQRRLLETGYHDVRYPTAGAALTARQALYMATSADGRTLGAAYPADASQANGALRSSCIGFAISSAASGGIASVMTGGVLGGFTGLTTGSVYYLDPSVVGGITTSRPSGVNFVVPVGYAVDANTLYVRIGSASGAPQLDPSFNSITLQPVTGDATATSLALRDASGTSKLSIDASGNVTAPSIFNIGTANISGTATANSVVSASGFKTIIGPAFMQQTVNANAQIGTQNTAANPNPLMYENGSSQYFAFKMPYTGSLVGLSVSYRYTAAQSSAPTIYIYPQINGTNIKFLPSFNSNNTAANVDYAFSGTQAKGLDTFKVNDGFTIAYSTTPFSAACTFYMRVSLWVEIAS